MKKSELQNRWKIAPYNTMFKDIEYYARKGKTHKLVNKLGIFSNRLDLRGYPFKGGIKKYKLSDCDLTYAVMDSVWLEKSIFDNVIFNNVLIDNLADHGNSFNNCAFINCVWERGVLGYESTKYTNCEFVNAKFKKTGFIKAEFRNCKFLKSKILCLDFNVSYFENVVFEGEFYDIMFRGEYPDSYGLIDFGIYRKNIMKNVDFSKARIRFLDTRDGIDLSSVIIPKDKYIFMVKNFKNFSNLAYANIDSYLKGTNLKSAKIYFEVLMEEANDGKQKDYIINLHDAEDKNTSDDLSDLLLNYLKKLKLV